MQWISSWGTQSMPAFGGVQTSMEGKEEMDEKEETEGRDGAKIKYNALLTGNCKKWEIET